MESQRISIKDVVRDAQPLLLELERILEVCDKFQKRTGCVIDESLIFDFEKIKEHKIFATDKDVGLLRICVAGRFSSGKSSFLNDLLEPDLLPVDTGCTTKAITRICYGPQKKFFYRNELISHDGYNKLVRDKQENFKITLPIPFLKGLVISDVPGFDPPKGADVDAKLSLNEMLNADVVFLLCHKSGGSNPQNQKVFLKTFLEKKQRKIPIYLIISQLSGRTSSSVNENARNRILIGIKNDLESMGIVPEDVFFFAIKHYLLKCNEDHQLFIENEKKRITDTIGKICQKHSDTVNRRIKFTIKELEQQFMQSLRGLSNKIKKHHNSWKTSYLELSPKLKKYDFVLKQNKGNLCEEFCCSMENYLNYISKLLGNVKFCYLFTNEGIFFDNHYINVNGDWKTEWKKQRENIESYVKCLPSYLQKYFRLPDSLIHEGHIPFDSKSYPRKIWNVEIKETYNDDWTGNEGDKGRLLKCVSKNNSEIRTVWKDKIKAHLEKRKMDFYDVVDRAYVIKDQEINKFESAYTELLKLDNLV